MAVAINFTTAESTATPVPGSALDAAVIQKDTVNNNLQLGGGTVIPVVMQNATSKTLETGAGTAIPLVAAGVFTFDTSLASATNVSVTGLGFTPRVVRLTVVSPTSGILSIGHFEAATNYSVRQSIASTYFVQSTTTCADIVVSTGNSQSFTGTLDVDGFTLANTKTGTPTGTATFAYEAYA